MKALVVYESLFGNTEEVARAVAAGLTQDMDVELVEVQHAPRRPGEDVALLVLGGPTHAFSMTRRRTRVDAFDQGATQGSRETGLREWLERLPSDHPAPVLATFDTKVGKARRLPGSAAKAAARAARRRGYRAGANPESFFVDDVKGPVLPGELDRAAEWGRQLAGTAAGASS